MKKWIIPFVLIAVIGITHWLRGDATAHHDQPVKTRTDQQDTVPPADTINQPHAAEFDTAYWKKYLMGKFLPKNDTNFILIPSKYSSKADAYMRKEAYYDFIQMHAAAAKEGIALTIVSATRNFDAQKGIWEGKWARDRYKTLPDTSKSRDILLFSSMPGTSRHHWGTDIDLNSVSPEFFKSGQGKKIYDWLHLNAPRFGYYQTYTNKSSGRTGYEEEAWHWTYLPISQELLNKYVGLIRYDDFQGFKGAQTAEELDVIRYYVQGIPDSLRTIKTKTPGKRGS